MSSGVLENSKTENWIAESHFFLPKTPNDIVDDRLRSVPENLAQKTSLGTRGAGLSFTPVPMKPPPPFASCPVRRRAGQAIPTATVTTFTGLLQTKALSHRLTSTSLSDVMKKSGQGPAVVASSQRVLQMGPMDENYSFTSVQPWRPGTVRSCSSLAPYS